MSADTPTQSSIKESASTMAPTHEAVASRSHTSVADVRGLTAVPPSTPSSVAEVREPFTFAGTIKPFTPDALANGFSTLVGALVGAMLAYTLQRRFQRALERKAALVAAHRVMFVLLQQSNTVLLIQRDYVYPELKEKGRYLSIPALPPFDTKKNVLELTELGFLLETTESRAILHDFYMAQENYLEALNQWNLRSALHHEKAQPAMAMSGIKSGDIVREEAIRAALGNHLFQSLVNSTDNSIEALRRAFAKLSDVTPRARDYFTKRFRTKDFTNFDFPETFGLTESKNA